MLIATRMIFRRNIRSLSNMFDKIDPGIQRRKKIVNSNEELEEIDPDDLESDFMNVHKNHRQHVEEMGVMLEKEKYHVVKQKYFKNKYPNFLTWNDKEQIKYLHTTNSEEWTIERLSEGFPALPEVIQKIVKSKWTKNETKIANHDVSVQKNWEMFNNGKIPNLPKELVEHLNKFTNRASYIKHFRIPDSKKVIKVHNGSANTEFSEIITSYEKLKNKSEETSENLHIKLNTGLLRDHNDKDTYLTVDKNEIKHRSPLTLPQLKSNIESKANRGKHLSEDDKLVIKRLEETTENKNFVELKQNNLTEIMKNKYETSEVGTIIRKTEQDFRHLIYPEKITIPKNKRKKGCTYKLNDCYYDYDGQFLYRVPGMEN